ncbi:MAG: MopE-related protein [Myxococcota bacterium]
MRFSALTLLVLFALPVEAFAHEFYASRVPNRATAENSAGTVKPCITCHNNPDGGAGCEESGGTRPCLNPFGMAFRTNMFRWNETLAAMDSDGDGFTNGQELQDPTGTWRPGEDDPGVEDYVTRPGFDTNSPGSTDMDGDGFCWFGQDLDDSGDCLGPGENDGSVDCDDDNAMVNSGADELCTNTIDDDCNGLSTLEDPVCEDVVDRDGDGVCRMGRDMNDDRDCIDPGEANGDVDCNDDEITVFPGNRENCSDGLDNDCNELTDEFDDMCRGDIDNDDDGFCPVGRDLNDDGDCLDNLEPEGGFDCDDTNPDVNPDETEICTDTVDNDCDGDANFDDSECAGFFDSDMDGHCPRGVDMDMDGNCVDPGEDIEPFDCNDSDPLVSPSAAEMCTDTVDNDCDGDVSLADEDCAGFLDRDGDRYCFVGFDMNRDGDCADPGEEGGSTDCDDMNPDVVPARGGELTIEICTDELDNNCDGSTDAFDPMCRDHRDRDGDGWCEVGRDGNGDGDCADADEQATDTSDPTMVDLAPDDSTVYPGAPENCFDRKDNDQDGLIDEGPALFDGDYRDDGDACVRDVDADSDGWCPIGQDVNGDGDCLDEGENIAESDCDDSNADRNPRAEEMCRNGFDDDCDGDVDLFDVDCFVLLDRDGDGFCVDGTDDNRDGDCLDEAEDRFGMDCDDTDPLINVRASEVCDDGVDNNCNGDIDSADASCPCDDSMCDDGDPCTIDGCNSDGCTNTPDPACMDGGTGADGGMMMGGGGGGCAATGDGKAPFGAACMAFALWVVVRRRR